MQCNQLLENKLPCPKTGRKQIMKQDHVWKGCCDECATVLCEGEGSRKDMENLVHRNSRDNLSLKEKVSDQRIGTFKNLNRFQKE